MEHGKTNKSVEDQIKRKEINIQDVNLSYQ